MIARSNKTTMYLMQHMRVATYLKRIGLSFMHTVRVGGIVKGKSGNFVREKLDFK